MTDLRLNKNDVHAIKPGVSVRRHYYNHKKSEAVRTHHRVNIKNFEDLTGLLGEVTNNSVSIQDSPDMKIVSRTATLLGGNRALVVDRYALPYDRYVNVRQGTSIKDDGFAYEVHAKEMELDWYDVDYDVTQDESGKSVPAMSYHATKFTLSYFDVHVPFTTSKSPLATGGVLGMHGRLNNKAWTFGGTKFPRLHVRFQLKGMRSFVSEEGTTTYSGVMSFSICPKKQSGEHRHPKGFQNMVIYLKTSGKTALKMKPIWGLANFHEHPITGGSNESTVVEEQPK